MGLGGTIGGGIFAALGLALSISGKLAPLTFLFAGLVALVSGYSFVQIESYLKKDGGTFTFMTDLLDNEFVAVFNGWMLLIGYVGTMGLYSYAFGAFAKSLLEPWVSIPRASISVTVMLVFTALNLVGVRESGIVEDLLVGFKMLVLVAFGLVGFAVIALSPNLALFQTLEQDPSFLSVFVAIPVIFVSFEGFELLSYEYSEMENPETNFRKGVYLTIIVSTLVYILIVVVVASVVTPQEIMQYNDTILAYAATRLFSNPVVNSLGFVIVSLTALFSTASAINATLFGTARLATTISEQGDLPSIFSKRTKKGIPHISLIAISGVTALLTFFGTLLQITTFASIAFLIVFGTANYVAYKSEQVKCNPKLPLAGLAIIGLSIPGFTIYLWLSNPAAVIFILATFIILLLLVIGFMLSKWRPIKDH